MDTLDEKIRKTYKSLETFIKSVSLGLTKSLIISGAAGVGKSHTVKKVLEQYPGHFTFIKGYAKATGLFKLLYDNRFSGNVLIFDDCDSIFYDEIALNLLKGALELSDTRSISWLSEKDFISETGDTIPKTFNYSGTIIFLTNLDFDDLIAKGNRIAPHLQALESRSLYFDIGLRSREELLCRIKQVVAESDIISSKGIGKYHQDDLISYLEEHINDLKELSIRTIEKLAIISISDVYGWRELANNVMLKKNLT